MLRMNWVVALLANLTLWTFVIIVAVSSAKVEADEMSGATKFFSNSTTWIANNFTWFYTLTQNVWVWIVMYVLFRKKYANIRLGRSDDAPVYSDLVWFVLIFTTGLGTGIFYFGVSEPMSYYRGDSGVLGAATNYLAKIPFINDDQRATMAMFMTFFHWGLHGWAPYIIVGLTTGVVCYRLGRPLTLRSAFYPIFGDYINGFVGDVIDAMSIATTTFGLSTSLGLGAKSINATVHRLNSSIPDDSEDIVAFIIWGITALTTIAVITGLNRGIVAFALLAFTVLAALVIILFTIDNTWYMANSFTQYLGAYIQYFILVGFDNDAMPQLNLEFQDGEKFIWGHTGMKDRVEAVLGTSMADPVEYYHSSPSWFMDGWTVFYWAWWITWAPFVGLFMAKISRGRTIRSVILVGMFAPMFTGFFVLSIFGSLGIRMQRIAELSLHQAPDWQKGVVNCAGLGYLYGEPVGSQAKALAEQAGVYALACRKSTEKILDILEPYGSLTRFLQTLVLLGVILFFVTSADAGAYTDDMISAGGIENPPVLQRIWWTVIQGATAQALVSSSKSGLSAIQSVSICAALPYTFALNGMCVALFRAMDEANGDPKHLSMRKGFSTSIVDIFDNFNGPDGLPEGKVMPTKARLLLLIKVALNPAHAMVTAALELFSPIQLTLLSSAYLIVYYAWIVLLCTSKVDAGTYSVAWLMYLVFVGMTTTVRYNLRNKWRIIGNLFDDFFVSLLLYPFALAQMKLEVESHKGRAPVRTPDASVRMELSVRRRDHSVRGQHANVFAPGANAEEQKRIANIA